MSVKEEETGSRKTELLLSLANQTRRAHAYVISKSEPTERRSKQLARQRNEILKEAFYEMTKWRGRQSVPSAINSQERSYHSQMRVTQPMEGSSKPF
jgi:hypothetical protein